MLITEALSPLAQAQRTNLRQRQSLRVRADQLRAKPIFKRQNQRQIQRAEQIKVHTMLDIGKRDLEANAISARVHGKGNLGAKPRAEAIAELLESIKDRRGS